MVLMVASRRLAASYWCVSAEQRQRARSAQGAAQFAAGHAAARRLYTNSTYFIFARKRLSL